MAVLTATAMTLAVLPTAGSTVTSANQTVSVAAGPRYIIENKQRITRVRVSVDNAASDSTYPSSGGMPLPTLHNSWGMTRNLDNVVFEGIGHTSSGLATARTPLWEYNPTAHSMIGWEVMHTLSASAGPTEAKGPQELATTWSPTLSPIPTVMYFRAYGW